MASQTIIECYQIYLQETPDTTKQSIIAKAIELLKESEDPDGFIAKLRTRLQNYDRKTISTVIREATNYKTKNIKIHQIAKTITD